MWDKRKKPKPIDVERKQELERSHKRNKTKKVHGQKGKLLDKQFERGLNLEQPVGWHRDRERKVASSDTHRGHHTYKKRDAKYEGEMALRELKANLETERKKQRVAPAFNKGGYQYITDDTDPSDLGRKT